MRKITKEEYLQEIEELSKDLNEVEEKLREIRSAGDISNSSDYDCARKLYSGIRLKLETLKTFVKEDRIRYDGLYEIYCAVKDYFREKYNDEIELPDFVNHKMDFILKNYASKRDELPSVNSFFHPYVYDDPNCFGSELAEDVKKSKDYFAKNKRNYIYVWETGYLALLLYYEQTRKVHIVNSLFSRANKYKDTELDELKRNCIYLNKQLKKEHKLNLSLFLWTIYQTYHYFRKNDSSYIIDKPCFSLINYLFKFAFLFFNGIKFDLVESKLTSEEKWFVRHVCGLLSNDLINTIIKCFPDYYFTNIMFLGYGCHIPGGCSDLDTSMDTFDSFLKGICDYDYWFDGDVVGDDFLLSKVRINKNYDKLKKEVFSNAIS